MSQGLHDLLWHTSLPTDLAVWSLQLPLLAGQWCLWPSLSSSARHAWRAPRNFAGANICTLRNHFASSRPWGVCKAQDVHGALLARLQAQAPGGGPDSVARLPVALREAAWVEAADCFTAMLPGQEVRPSACIVLCKGAVL